LNIFCIPYKACDKRTETEYRYGSHFDIYVYVYLQSVHIFITHKQTSYLK